jgi:hypothetical protein
MYTHHWVTWTVTEYKRQEDIDRARCQELAEMALRGSETQAGSPWWRTALLSAAATGRVWMGRSETMAPSMDVSPRLSANEGFGVC